MGRPARVAILTGGKPQATAGATMNAKDYPKKRLEANGYAAKR